LNRDKRSVLSFVRLLRESQKLRFSGESYATNFVWFTRRNRPDFAHGTVSKSYGNNKPDTQASDLKMLAALKLLVFSYSYQIQQKSKPKRIKSEQTQPQISLITTMELFKDGFEGASLPDCGCLLVLIAHLISSR
jgi:hypothetical protein